MFRLSATPFNPQLSATRVSAVFAILLCTPSGCPLFFLLVSPRTYQIVFDTLHLSLDHPPFCSPFDYFVISFLSKNRKIFKLRKVRKCESFWKEKRFHRFERHLYQNGKAEKAGGSRLSSSLFFSCHVCCPKEIYPWMKSLEVHLWILSFAEWKVSNFIYVMNKYNRCIIDR